MVVIPAGTFMMGARQEYEKPVHRVQIDKAFAIGRFEITFAEWTPVCEQRPLQSSPGRSRLGA
jgi:formylglycine-generating enzyme required for sulfatase activity